MAFTKYSSMDVNGPGPLLGTAGDLLRVLDAILVNGYTGGAAAGWTKPFSNSGNLGCYKQGTGSSGHTLVINDNGPNGTSTYKEAWMIGWKTLTALSGSYGAGSGQFPIPGHVSGSTDGKLVFRKSTTADSTQRPWIAFADAKTFYFFVIIGEASYTTTYTGYGFGDYYSEDEFEGSPAFIFGQRLENSNPMGAVTLNALGYAVTMAVTPANFQAMYSSRGASAGAPSCQLILLGDASFGSGQSLGTGYNRLNGCCGIQLNQFDVVQIPQGESNPQGSRIRGRMRGLWHPNNGQGLAHFGLGAGIAGSPGGNLDGKTWFAITPIGQAENVLLVETSDTLEN